MRKWVTFCKEQTHTRPARLGQNFQLDNADDCLLYAGGSGCPIGVYYPGLEIYLRRNEASQGQRCVNIGPPVRSILVGTEGSIDEVQRVVTSTSDNPMAANG